MDVLFAKFDIGRPHNVSKQATTDIALVNKGICLASSSSSYL